MWGLCVGKGLSWDTVCESSEQDTEVSAAGLRLLAFPRRPPRPPVWPCHKLSDGPSQTDDPDRTGAQRDPSSRVRGPHW